MALILNVDLYSTIRLYQVFGDLTELIFAVNLSDLLRQKKKDDEEDPSDVPEFEISTVEFFVKVKMLLITTLDGKIFLISP